MHVGNQAGAAQFREHFAFKGGEHLGHVADFVLTHGGITVHGQDTQDEVFVLQVAFLDQLLETFPVLTHAAHGGIHGVNTLGHLLPGLVGAGRTVSGQVVVQALGAFRGSVGHNLGAGNGGVLILGGLLQESQEFLHGLALKLRVAHIGAVHQILDLSFRAGRDDFLVVVLFVGQVSGALHQHVGGVGAVGHLEGGQGDGLVAGNHFPAQFQIALLHAFHVVEVHFLGHFLAVLGHHFVIVPHIFSLILEGFHGGFSTFIDNHGSHFHHHVGIEVIFGIGYAYSGIDGAGDYLQDGRGAFGLHIL